MAFQNLQSGTKQKNNAWKRQQLLTKTSHANCGISSANLLLVGKHLLDQSHQKESPNEWYKRMLSVLAEESHNYDSAEMRLKLEARDIARFQKMVRKN